MLPSADSYSALTGQFRWQVPERYNIGVDVCDRWAALQPDRIALIFVGRGRQGARLHLRRPPRLVEPHRQPAARSGHRARRPRRHAAAPGAGDRRRPTSRPISSARSPCRCSRCSVPRRWNTGWAIPARGRSSPIATACAKLAEIRAGLPDLTHRAVHRRRRRRAAWISTAAGGQSRRVRAGRHRRRRSGAHHLHLGHHRPAQGRAARPSRAARSSAGRRDEPRPPAAAGRPHLDAGRLGLDRRAARRADAGAASRRAGGGAPLREIHRRGGVRS